MAFLKNGTMSGGGGGGGSSTSTAGYNFPSGSFKHPKQQIANANMPNDQKAKLLAMHRDGKANAGIYVAVVLVVYFILITILLCRYGKRRRRPEASSALDTAAERGGRLQILSFRIGKIATCGGGDEDCCCCGCCCGNVSNLLCFGRCQRVDASSAKRTVLHHSSLQNENSEISKVGGGKGKNNMDDSSSQQKDKEDGGERNVKKCLVDKGEGGQGKGGKAVHVQEVSQGDYQTNEDSEESLEDD